MILDFKEIPAANGNDGLQDTFELFTRDLLQYLGYRIIENPDRGADGKRDLIVEEVVRGIHSEYTIRWLVSCKHYAHSGKAVKDDNEINIRERIEQHKCDGFMGVYSTLPATSLAGILKGVKNHIVYDHEKIESLLLRDAEGQRIAARYFAESYRNFQIENPVPAQIFADNSPIICEVCGRNLLDGESQGIFVSLKPFIEPDEDSHGTDRQIKEIHFVCKGECDNTLKDSWRGSYNDSWGELDDLKNPTIWISTFIGFINGIHHDQDLSNEAFDAMKQMFIRTYPYVARHLTSHEKERVKQLIRFGLL